MRAVSLTGATSMIGIALIKQCLKNNIKVIAFIRPDSSRKDRIPISNLITVIECSLDNIANFDVPANLGSDVFFHIGWLNTDKRGRESCSKQIPNIGYTVDAVHLAKKLGCQKFIGIGSQSEYGQYSVPLNSNIPVNPDNAYGVTKYAAGKLSKIECEKVSIEHIWIRILHTYGTNDNDEMLIKSFIFNCKRNQHMALGPCTHIYDYLFEDDTGRALFLLGQKGVDGKIYCLGSGIGKPLKEYLEIIKNMINPDYICGYGEIPYTDKSIRYHCADVSDLTDDVGFVPEISFEEGIKEIIRIVD
jgi:nucleoside-diphosphate-sugar epimerase